MPIIIDGWNLIRNDLSPIDDYQADSIEAVKELVSLLIAYQSSHKDPIIVVFDSKNEYLGLEYRNNASLSIVASSNADDFIKRLIDDIPERQRRNARVVSSDNEIYFYAKSSYAVPVRSEEFWRRLERGTDKRHHNRRQNVRGEDI